MIAHLGGLPVEEALLPLVGSFGAVLLTARALMAGVSQYHLRSGGSTTDGATRDS